jgi:hypothetical protein
MNDKTCKWTYEKVNDKDNDKVKGCWISECGSRIPYTGPNIPHRYCPTCGKQIILEDDDE